MFRERKSYISPILNQKLRLRNDLAQWGWHVKSQGRLKAKPVAPNSRVVTAKKIKSATPLNTQIVRKQNILIAHMEKPFSDWIEDQTNHNFPLSQSLIQREALTVFKSMKAERWRSCIRKVRVWFMRFKERNHLHNIKVQGEAAIADVEAVQVIQKI